jgi:hypothetical protein
MHATLRFLFVLLAVSGCRLMAATEPALDFNREVRPILAQHCFHCHGQDAKERKAKLRLDEPGSATAVRDGHAAIVPGKPSESELVKRLHTSDPDDLMPPPEAKRPLSPEQMAVLERWVAQGAHYDRHWSFVPPRTPAIPAAGDGWARSPTDHFIAARLSAANLAPTTEAAPHTWLRRASLDLIGLPPEPAELDAFVADVTKRGEAAYGDAVDRLLASPRFGERQAQDWLDVARYADTHGFNNDSARSMWRWRDWVIDAYNADMPYDRFLTAQLAGDLLPDATLDDRIATGFCRNHVINSEGGIIDEEYRVEYVADRVRTLGLAFMGLTLECARCHDHKYDPVSQRDYYQLFAAFNQVDEHGEDGRVANARPLLRAPTVAQQRQLAGLIAGIATADQALTKTMSAHQENPWTALNELGLGDGDLLTKPALHLVSGADGAANAARPDAKPFAGTGATLVDDPALGAVLTPPTGGVELAKDLIDLAKPWSFISLIRWDGGAGTVLSSIDWRTNRAAAGFGAGNEILVRADGRIEIRRSQMWPTYAAQVVAQEPLIAGAWHHLTVTSDGTRSAAGIRLFVDGREVATELLADDLGGSPGGTPRLGARLASDAQPFNGRLADLRLLQRVLDPTAVQIVGDAALARLVRQMPDARLLEWARLIVARQRDPVVAAAWAQREAQHQALLAVQRLLPTTMVMSEMAEPRATHVLLRGAYDAHGDAVTVDVPSSLGVPWPSGAPRNRLGLARWLTDPEHPLTARVAVNRIWQRLFGIGLVRTAEDFGQQGEFPSHPELLDHLARRFIAGGWRMKPLIKELVLSATYRQSSHREAAAISVDPEDRLLAGSPRLRLPAEMLRDQALTIGGLLRQRLGGPSVFPYQPDELYKTVVVDAPYPGTEWVPSTGDDRFRRSLYIFWKRTVPHPVMTAFDVPDRESCTARRARTNTPLQSLVLLNEPGFVEAARGLGTRLLHSDGDDRARLILGFRLATARQVTTRELLVLETALARGRSSFTPDSAKRYLAVGTVPPDPAFPPVELAAWSTIGSLLLNLDATISRD